MESPTTPTIGPTRPEERIAILDILRGFALLGIAILNMGGFKSPDAAWSLDVERFPDALDRAVAWAIEAFGSGKFNATFSFLFGVGLTIQMTRAQAKGAPFVGLYLRRLAFLLILGVGHALLIWDGDVLHIYAILGLGLLLLRKAPDRLVMTLAILFLVAPIVNKAIKVYRDEPPSHTQSYYREKLPEQIRIYARGTHGEQVRDRLRSIREEYIERRDYWFFAEMAVTMLVGFLAGRRRVFQDLPSHMWEVRASWRWCLVPGLACGLFAATADALGGSHEKATLLALAGSAAYELARPILSMAYIAGLTLLSERPGWRDRLAPLAFVGRMPLTNYLMQSVIATTIFYGHGLGLFGKVGPALGLLISLAIFGVQVIYSRWWMTRFRFGPMEWLWRAVTYGRWPDLATRPETAG